MKAFLALTLTLAFTAAFLVGCGCTKQDMNNTSAPTVLPTNEEIWNSTETTTQITTETTVETEAITGSTDTTRGINETQVQNHVNAHNDMMDEIKNKEKTASTENTTEHNSSRMMPRKR